MSNELYTCKASFMLHNYIKFHFYHNKVQQEAQIENVAGTKLTQIKDEEITNTY